MMWVVLRLPSPQVSRVPLEDFTTEAYTDETDPSKNYPAYEEYYFYKKAVAFRNPGFQDYDTIHILRGSP